MLENADTTMLEYPKEDWMSPKVETRESNVGKGMFAKESIKAGEEVVIFGGESCNTKEAAEWKKKGKMVMQWDDDLWTYEDRGEVETYFINHSCDGNLSMEGLATLTAKRDIAKDEEISADYVLWEADENEVKAWECQCGSPLCRHKITGKDYLLPELQQKYKDHFSILINKRINILKPK